MSQKWWRGVEIETLKDRKWSKSTLTQVGTNSVFSMSMKISWTTRNFTSVQRKANVPIATTIVLLLLIRFLKRTEDHDSRQVERGPQAIGVWLISGRSLLYSSSQQWGEIREKFLCKVNRGLLKLGGPLRGAAKQSKIDEYQDEENQSNSLMPIVTFVVTPSDFLLEWERWTFVIKIRFWIVRQTDRPSFFSSYCWSSLRNPGSPQYLNAAFSSLPCRFARIGPHSFINTYILSNEVVQQFFEVVLKTFNRGLILQTNQFDLQLLHSHMQLLIFLLNFSFCFDLRQHLLS